jgi:tetratricopeptide (TPR) repeat protein
MRALAAEQEDDEAAAMREYNIGLAQDPKSALLHAGLGHVYRQRMDLPSAERELAEAWRLDSSDPAVAFELGDTEQRLGKTQAALELLNQALELDASLLVARWSRAKAYLAMGDNERALADLEAAAPADSSGDLQWQLARLYRKLGRVDLAAQAEKRSEEQRMAATRRLETK